MFDDISTQSQSHFALLMIYQHFVDISSKVQSGFVIVWIYHQQRKVFIDYFADISSNMQSGICTFDDISTK